MRNFCERNHLSMMALLCAVLFLSWMGLNAQADIVWSGDVSPTDPATWTAATDGYIGKTSQGTVSLDGGSVLLNDDCEVGYNAGAAGAVTVSGSGSKWTNSILTLGNRGFGSLNITDGGQVSASVTYLGYQAGSSYMASVTGTGSKWTSSFFTLGLQGSGSLNVEAGGQVKFDSFSINKGSAFLNTVRVSGTGSILNSDHGGQLYVGGAGQGALIIEAGGQVNDFDGHITNNSSVTVTGAGSRWLNGRYYGGLWIHNIGKNSLTVSDGGEVTANALFAPVDSLFGNGVITTKGAVLDGDFSVDVNQGPQPTIAFGTGGIVTLNATLNDLLGAGYQGVGTMKIGDGVSIASKNFYLGYDPGSSGTATISGSGSINQVLYTNVGFSGVGILRVEKGGQLGSGTFNFLGYNAGSDGTATIADAGSKWTSGTINVGYNGTGTLNILNGGTVEAGGIKIKNQSLLAIDVGNGSSLIVNSGGGTINNGSKVRILAGASAVPDTVYKPISAGTWSGSGVYEAVGGTWNSTTHEFTVSGVQTGTSGTAVTIDRSSLQRMLIEDSVSSWKLGMSFAATTASAPLAITATAVSDGPLNSLAGMLNVGDSILGGWNLEANSGFTAGDPIYLSFKDGIGGGYSTSSMHVWSYDGTKWSPIVANDITFDGNYVSFTTNSVGCYAVTVPEPGMIVLLAFGLGILLSGKCLRFKS